MAYLSSHHYQCYQIYMPLLVLFAHSCIPLYETAIIRCSPVSGKQFEEVNLNHSDVARFCNGAKTITLVGEDVLYAKSINSSVLHWMLGIQELRMCIVVERTNLNVMHVKSEIVRGNCSGSVIRIVNNDILHLVMINPKILVDLCNKSAQMDYSEKAIIVRGNRRLSAESISTLMEALPSGYEDIFDVQVFGECGLPAPFLSFVDIDNCSLLYGPLHIAANTSIIPQPTKKFKYEGCLKIENSSLVSVDFLQAFSPFKKMQPCQQYIRFNDRLCIKDAKVLLKVFGDIQILDNKMACDCHGGIVTEEYLNNITGCKHIEGDLEITNWANPQNADVLRNIESITGRLVIENNTGLFNFTYFVNLKNIGENTGTEAVIVVRDNLDLYELPLPQLCNITISPEDSRVDFWNNPRMKMRREETTPAGDSTLISKASQPGTRSTSQTKSAIRKLTTTGGTLQNDTEADDVKDEFSSEISNAWKDAPRCTSLVLLVFVLILIATLVFTLLLTKTAGTECVLPPPPYKLNKKAMEILTSLCTEILEDNPLVWYAKDCQLLCYSGQLADLINEVKLSSALLLPMVPNARLPNVKMACYKKILHQRLHYLLNFDYVIMTGQNYGTSNMLPLLPIEIGERQVYTGDEARTELEFHLVKRTTLSANTVLFKYAVTELLTKRRSELTIVFYHWASNRLPQEYCELLQLSALSALKNAACLSDRKKEIFALLLMIVTKVKSAKEKVHIAKLLKDHSRACNGAPLDRSEVLFAMRFTLEWAWKAGCIPPEMHKKFEKWRTAYSYMSRYSDMHVNVMSIHPRHLQLSDKGLEELLHGLHISCSPPFMERKRSPMYDQFHMLPSVEKQGKVDSHDTDNPKLEKQMKNDGNSNKKDSHCPQLKSK